ncbi:50S ribosomal protein L21 [Engelhardtia mirabilis]|uniref:Large ribosomal subunit protein bL21 n=1 Tax=Engelhardtia mirabilis TaxID=2528011 RepID=A0A518BP93_9BACT|nr:50S ribosomal protein L21 [Planctomycetes bacterium Pla133]QDV03124.1 50S ribosomal protein L21 [Planctomycetes bacterium Pla86]
MYAVISDRGRQSTVRVGDVVNVDLQSSAEPGSEITFDKVLLVGGEGGARIGTPTVDGASVTAKVIGDSRGKKLVVFRFKRRKNVRVKRGHRQTYTQVEILGING